MNSLLLCTLRRAGILLGLALLAALSLGLAAPAIAAPKQAITTSFDPSTGVLKISGDEQDNIIVVGRDAAGAILVNGGAVPITGGPATVAKTKRIDLFGRAGHDRLLLAEANGPLPSAHISGGDGNDTLAVTGGDEDEAFAASSDGTRVRFERTSPSPFALDIGAVETLVLNARGGNDTFTTGFSLAPPIKIS